MRPVVAPQVGQATLRAKGGRCRGLRGVLPAFFVMHPCQHTCAQSPRVFAVELGGTNAPHKRGHKQQLIRSQHDRLSACAAIRYRRLCTYGGGCMTRWNGCKAIGVSGAIGAVRFRAIYRSSGAGYRWIGCIRGECRWRWISLSRYRCFGCIRRRCIKCAGLGASGAKRRWIECMPTARDAAIASFPCGLRPLNALTSLLTYLLNSWISDGCFESDARRRRAPTPTEWGLIAAPKPPLGYCNKDISG